ncbi:MAG: helix-turn-helix domain-containing protein [Burkholderiales bacterium]
MMKDDKSVGELLISALQDALDTPGAGKVLNPKFDVKALRKRLKLTQQAFAEQYHINIKTLTFSGG